MKIKINKEGWNSINVSPNTPKQNKTTGKKPSRTLNNHRRELA
jgi:hypothetical protein